MFMRGLWKSVFEHTPLNMLSELLVRKERKFSVRLTGRCSVSSNPPELVSHGNQKEPVGRGRNQAPGSV